MLILTGRQKVDLPPVTVVLPIVVIHGETRGANQVALILIFVFVFRGLGLSPAIPAPCGNLLYRRI
jgi:hypothetical protein